MVSVVMLQRLGPLAVKCSLPFISLPIFGAATAEAATALQLNLSCTPTAMFTPWLIALLTAADAA